MVEVLENGLVMFVCWFVCFVVFSVNKLFNIEVEINYGWFEFLFNWVISVIFCVMNGSSVNLLVECVMK